VNDFDWTYDIDARIRITKYKELSIGDRVCVTSCVKIERISFGLFSTGVVTHLNPHSYLVRFDERFSDNLHGGSFGENHDPTRSSLFFPNNDFINYEIYKL
jgi:hypothetical protein